MEFADQFNAAPSWGGGSGHGSNKRGSKSTMVANLREEAARAAKEGPTSSPTPIKRGVRSSRSSRLRKPLTRRSSFDGSTVMSNSGQQQRRLSANGSSNNTATAATTPSSTSTTKRDPYKMGCEPMSSAANRAPSRRRNSNGSDYPTVLPNVPSLSQNKQQQNPKDTRANIAPPTRRTQRTASSRRRRSVEHSRADSRRSLLGRVDESSNQTTMRTAPTVAVSSDASSRRSSLGNLGTSFKW